MKYKYSDGGRAKSKRPKQINDCAVVAVANGYSIPYDMSFDIFKLNGRKDNCGASTKTVLESIGNKIQKTNQNIENFCKRKGAYIVRVVTTANNGQKYGHAFSIKDGVIYNNWPRKHFRKLLSYKIDWYCKVG